MEGVFPVAKSSLWRIRAGHQDALVVSVDVCIRVTVTSILY